MYRKSVPLHKFLSLPGKNELHVSDGLSSTNLEVRQRQDLPVSGGSVGISLKSIRDLSQRHRKSNQGNNDLGRERIFGRPTPRTAPMINLQTNARYRSFHVGNVTIAPTFFAPSPRQDARHCIPPARASMASATATSSQLDRRSIQLTPPQATQTSEKGNRSKFCLLRRYSSLLIGYTVSVRFGKLMR